MSQTNNKTEQVSEEILDLRKEVKKLWGVIETLVDALETLNMDNDEDHNIDSFITEVKAEFETDFTWIKK